MCLTMCTNFWFGNYGNLSIAVTGGRDSNDCIPIGGSHPQEQSREEPGQGLAPVSASPASIA